MGERCRWKIGVYLMAQSCCTAQGHPLPAADGRKVGSSLISGLWGSGLCSGAALGLPRSLFRVSRLWALTKRCPSDANQ